MTIKTLLLAGAAIAATIAVPAQAAQGDVLVRLRGIMVAPNERAAACCPPFPAKR